MFSLNNNPRTWLGLHLDRTRDQRVFMSQLVDDLNALSASIAAGAGGGGAGAPVQVALNNTAVTANQTVDCTGATSVWINYVLTGAINLVTTLNNLSSGTQVFWRVKNSSGATRTLTLAANSPGAVAYSVQSNVWAGLATWSSGVAVNNNAYGSFLGQSANLSGSWLLYGLGGNE